MSFEGLHRWLPLGVPPLGAAPRSPLPALAGLGLAGGGSSFWQLRSKLINKSLLLTFKERFVPKTTISHRNHPSTTTMTTSRTPTPSRKPSLILVGSFAALLGAPLALSTPLYWLGTTDENFNADNWTSTSGTAVVSGLIPASNDALYFDTAEASFNNLAGSFTINNNLADLTGLALAITDNSATADFNITGHAITIGSAGITSQVLNGTGATLSFGGTGITLEAAASFNAIFGNLTINSLVDNGGNLLTVTGPGDTTINAALSGIGGLHKTRSAPVGRQQFLQWPHRSLPRHRQRLRDQRPRKQCRPPRQRRHRRHLHFQ